VAYAASLKHCSVVLAQAQEITAHARSQFRSPCSLSGKCIFAGSCSCLGGENASASDLHMRWSCHSLRGATLARTHRPPRCSLKRSFPPRGETTTAGTVRGAIYSYLVSTSHRGYRASCRTPSSTLTSNSTLQHAMARSEVVVRQRTPRRGHHSID
jgi:hypothetical protein